MDAKVHARTHLSSPKEDQGQASGVSPPLRGGVHPEPEKEDTPLETVRKLALCLSAPERKQLVAHLALSLRPAAPDGTSRDLDMWVGALSVSVAGSVGQGGQGLGPILLKHAVSSPANWGHVHGFMESAGLAGLTVVERQAAYSALADMLVRYAKSVGSRRGIPMSAKFLAAMSSELPAIFDHNFPGYLASGLAPMLIRGLGRAPQSDV